MSATDGNIRNINVTTIGGVVKYGEVTLQILPSSSDFIINAKVSTADIVYVKEGQDAELKLNDYVIFSATKGTDNYISSDKLTEQMPK